MSLWCEPLLCLHSDCADAVQFHAAVAGSKDTIGRLLGPQSASDKDLSSWLVPPHAACQEGHLECAKPLVASGNDINCIDEHGGTPLVHAAVGGRTDIVRWLLKNGADPQVRETRGVWDWSRDGDSQDAPETMRLESVRTNGRSQLRRS